MNTLLTILMVLGILIAAYFLYMLIIAFIPLKPVPQQVLEKGKQKPKDSTEPHPSRKEVSFNVKGSEIKAWFYLPDKLRSAAETYC